MNTKRSEHATQNDIRNSLCDVGLFFRANVGQAWASNDITRLPDGSLLLRNPRPFSTGLPPGFHDIFGMVTLVITPEMVGQKIAVFTSMDAKSQTGRKRDAQVRFARAVRDAGGRSGFARDTATAIAIAKGDHHECE
jgi:hypothetical protein